MAVFSFLHTGRCTYVYMLHARLYYDTCALLYDTCAPLHPPVYMYVNIQDQNDNATYASTRWVPTVRHFLACEDVASRSQQSGGESFFCPDALPCVRRCSWWVPAVRGRIIFLPVIWTHFLACEDVAGGSQQSGGNVFFAKYGGPSGGSPLSGGGIIILRVIRRHFLAVAVDPAVSLST